MQTEVARIEENRLRWHCRRGLLELDLVLRRFMDNRYATLKPPEVELLKELLDYPDQDLWDMIIGRLQPADKRVTPVLEMLRAA
ncbi:MAG: succinate dehydrogenase assembly factor 2 [Proteobacteria bacterium]|nr:succinate dehydrogenase assembly factor 2 [Burkholderiales bacterium]